MVPKHQDRLQGHLRIEEALSPTRGIQRGGCELLGTVVPWKAERGSDAPIACGGNGSGAFSVTYGDEALFKGPLQRSWADARAAWGPSASEDCE